MPKRTTEWNAEPPRRKRQRNQPQRIEFEEIPSQPVTNFNESAFLASFRFPPTPEQRAILSAVTSGPRRIPHHEKGRVVRITAAAGTGKTTTLEMLAAKLVGLGHKVLYLVYNKVAQEEANSRFQRSIPRDRRNAIECLTMHAMAFRMLGLEEKGEKSSESRVVDDEILKRKIKVMFADEIEAWVLSSSTSHKPANKVNDQIELAAHWVFKTLERWYRSAAPLDHLARNDYYTYYPAKKDHKEKIGGEAGMFYVKTAREIWDKIWKNDLPLTHDIYLKKAQLDSLQMASFTVILLDESQDVNACQLDAFVTQQTSKPQDGRKKDIFIVGDTVQSIYSFRGAQPQLIQSISGEVEGMSLFLRKDS